MQTLKITVQACRMVIPAMPIHFDDVIAYAAVQEYLSQGSNDGISDYDPILNNLPIEKAGDDINWVYKASIFRWTHLGKFMRSYSQRIDPEKIALNRNQGTLKYGSKEVNSASGPLKSSINLLPSTAYSVGVAYCIGDKSKLESLLSHIKHLGKKHNRGSGEVLKWTIEDSDQLEAWQDRFLPITLGSYKIHSHNISSSVGVRPPYWKDPQEIGLVVV